MEKIRVIKKWNKVEVGEKVYLSGRGWKVVRKVYEEQENGMICFGFEDGGIEERMGVRDVDVERFLKVGDWVHYDEDIFGRAIGKIGKIDFKLKLVEIDKVSYSLSAINGGFEIENYKGLRDENVKLAYRLNGSELNYPMLFESVVGVDGMNIIDRGEVVRKLDDELLDEIRVEENHAFQMQYGYLFN